MNFDLPQIIKISINNLNYCWKSLVKFLCETPGVAQNCRLTVFYSDAHYSFRESFSLAARVKRSFWIVPLNPFFKLENFQSFKEMILAIAVYALITNAAIAGESC